MVHVITDDKLNEIKDVKIRRAMVSVSDKNGLDRFARGLIKHDVEIISTGGTAAYLTNAGIEVTAVSDLTKFPEMLEGRVKTLHPVIHGGLLADRRKDSHMRQIEEHGIKPIDLVVINLYPFKETISREGVTLDEAIENIDIGGPSMIRSAAKNFFGVAVVVSPKRYAEILTEMDANDGSLGLETRKDLAKEAFEHTADYDETIYEYLEDDHEFPPMLKLVFEKVQDLRYGENPHQKAAFYRDEITKRGSLADMQQLHGQELSYNNILDLDAAWRIIGEFLVPAAVIIKHNNPSGVALADNTLDAFEKAWKCDPVSAFGSVISFNRIVDETLARKITENFVEAVIAPGFHEEALEVLTTKKNLRLLSMGEDRPNVSEIKDIKRVEGGVLVQDMDPHGDNRREMKAVTELSPTDEQWEDLLFAWRVAKHVKSNAIVLVKNLATIGIGAGQMSRVDSSELAIKKAGGPEKCAGSVMASDAFFPFKDALDAASAAGIKAVIQPGGSIRDNEVIEAANQHKMAMVFTGRRHFRH